MTSHSSIVTNDNDDDDDGGGGGGGGVASKHTQHHHEVYENFKVFIHSSTETAAAATTTDPISSVTELSNNNSQLKFGHCLFSVAGLSKDTSEFKASIAFQSSTKERPDSIIVLRFGKEGPLPSNVAECIVPIGHSFVCPARLAHDIELQKTLNLAPLAFNKELRVGVCVVVEHLSHILITRRSKRLRTFPMKWVFPGGHVNQHEELEQAAKRETLEETGLRVSNLRLFAMWESCFPTFIESGTPVAHHLVLYYLGSLEDKFDILPTANEMKIQIDEVDAIAWVNETDIRRTVLKGTAHSNDPHLINAWVAEDDDSERRELLRWVRKKVAFDNDANRSNVAPPSSNPTIDSSLTKQTLALGTSFVLSKWADQHSQ